jgi:hypothetical protein
VQDTSPQAASMMVRAADAMLVLHVARAKIDWERLITQAQKRRLLLPVMDILSYLQENLDAPLPASVLHRIQALPISKWERTEYRFKARRSELWGGFPAHWFNYSRRNSHASWLQRIFGFPRFLQHTWRLNYVWQVPAYVTWKGVRRLLGRQ